MSHLSMDHVKFEHEPCNTREWVTSHMRMRCVGCENMYLSAQKASWNPVSVKPGLLKSMKIGKHFSLELMVQIKPKKVYGVETPHPRSFLGRMKCIRIGCENMYIRQHALEYLRLSDTLHLWDHVTYKNEVCRVWEYAHTTTCIRMHDTFWHPTPMRMSHVTYENQSCHI